MHYVYMVMEKGGPPLGAWTRRYELQDWLKKYFQAYTTFDALKCYRVRGSAVTEIDPYQLITPDQGEL